MPAVTNGTSNCCRGWLAGVGLTVNFTNGMTYTPRAEVAVRSAVDALIVIQVMAGERSAITCISICWDGGSARAVGMARR